MNSVTRPPIDANGVGHGGDDLDEALFAFFRSEMPRPWPQLQLPDGAPPSRPAVRPAPAPSPRPWFRRPRFALAASVALLVAGSAVMSAALTPPAPSEKPSLDGAGRKAIEREMRQALPDDGDVGMKIESLDQIGNDPTTINIKVFKNK
jgi:hypothetical protein